MNRFFFNFFYTNRKTARSIDLRFRQNGSDLVVGKVTPEGWKCIILAQIQIFFCFRAKRGVASFF